MNTIEVYLLQIVISAGISIAAVAYFRPHLRGILKDLCGTDERAQFWVIFSSILLVGVPLVFGLGYQPDNSVPEMLFFDAASQVRFNMIGFLMALIGIGVFVSFFALVAPRQKKEG